MSVLKYNEPLNIGNCFTGVTNYKWEVGKQFDWIYRLCLIKANSDYSEFYWIQPWGDVELLGHSLEEACNSLDDIHTAEQEADTFQRHGVYELPENVVELCTSDLPF